ncbi:hypothetical protein [Oceanobacillus massiliensis]|uniref:hypothetical protein n=1 Tax=Oceanobacillus massiliensis TaxID=1465765 RepID=UPI0002880E49|nr:hypothetical protein [Oceanobacillus massiliensis]
MKRKQQLYPLMAGLAGFGLTFIVTLLIESTHPFLASLVLGFIIFEISFYYFHSEEKRINEL